MMKHPIAVAALAAAGFLAWLPNAAVAQVGVTIVIGHPPPPPRYERIPHPRTGYIWVQGYWDWNGYQYIWVHGHWERMRHGEIYRHPQWHHERNGWQLDRGGWYVPQGHGQREERRDHRNIPPAPRHDRPEERRGPDRR